MDLYLTEVEVLDEDYDCPSGNAFYDDPYKTPEIEQDEYAFIQWNLERWHDRAYPAIKA